MVNGVAAVVRCIGAAFDCVTAGGALEGPGLYESPNGQVADG